MEGLSPYFVFLSSDNGTIAEFHTSGYETP